ALALDDVIVGDDEAVGRDDDARAERVLHALARNAEIFAEETAEERVVEEWRNLLLRTAAHIDVHDRGRGFLDDRRIRESDVGAASGNRLFELGGVVLRLNRPRQGRCGDKGEREHDGQTLYGQAAKPAHEAPLSLWMAPNCCPAK